VAPAWSFLGLQRGIRGACTLPLLMVVAQSGEGYSCAGARAASAELLWSALHAMDDGRLSSFPSRVAYARLSHSLAHVRARGGPGFACSLELARSIEPARTQYFDLGRSTFNTFSPLLRE
jgi:hypothetical protein